MTSTKTFEEIRNMIFILGTVCEEYFHDKYKNQDDFSFAGWNLFPGNMEEYNQWVETKNIARKIYNDLSSKIYRLSREELAIIEKMISE